MALYGQGVFRSVTIATETTFGTQASGPGQLLRRVQFQMEENPPVAQSQEINPDGMPLDTFLGMISASGSLSGQLSPGSYKMIFEAIMRGTWTAGVTRTMTDSVLTIGGGGVITLTSAASNFLTVGFKRGDIVRFSGITGAPIALNAINLIVTAVTATTMTLAPNSTAVAWTGGSQASVIVAVTGKKVFTPVQASQVDRSFTVEDWSSDTSLSRLGRGIKFSQISLNVQPNGYVNFSTAFAGKNIDRATSRVYASPTAASTSLGVRTPVGQVLYGGSVLGYITGFNIQIAQALQPAMVVGPVDGTPAIAVGMITVNGSIQALLTSDTMTADFIAQNDVELCLFMPVATAASSDFVSIYVPRARLMGRQAQDSDRLIARSYPFSSIQMVAGGSGTAYDNSLVTIQDSLA